MLRVGMMMDRKAARRRVSEQTAEEQRQKAAVARVRTALDGILVTMRGMVLRPGMYGDPCCLEVSAMHLIALRRVLLGADADAPAQPGRKVGVYDRLLKERFKTSVTPAYCHLRDPDEHVARDKTADFIAEWWRREQSAVPDPERDTAAEEERLAAVLARVAALSDKERHEARLRAVRSWDRPDYAVQHDGCRIEGGEVVWPSGERWPMAGGADEPAAVHRRVSLAL